MKWSMSRPDESVPLYRIKPFSVILGTEPTKMAEFGELKDSVQGGTQYLHVKWPEFLTIDCKEPQKTAVFIWIQQRCQWSLYEHRTKCAKFSSCFEKKKSCNKLLNAEKANNVKIPGRWRYTNCHLAAGAHEAYIPSKQTCSSTTYVFYYRCTLRSIYQARIPCTLKFRIQLQIFPSLLYP